jgi:hypothetical protein
MLFYISSFGWLISLAGEVVANIIFSEIYLMNGLSGLSKRLIEKWALGLTQALWFT